MRKRKGIGYGWKGSFAAAMVVFTGSVTNAASITFDYGDLMDSATTTPAAIASGVSGTLSTGDIFSGVADFEAAFKEHVWEQTDGTDTIRLTATAHNGDVNDTEIWLYGDSSYRGQAGLGAIQKIQAEDGGTISDGLGGSADIEVANPSSADNAAFVAGPTGFNETVTLTANKTVSLDALSLVDADHDLLTFGNSNVQISIDGGTFLALNNNFFANIIVTGTMFEFQINDGNPSGNTEFYIKSAAFSVVPDGSVVVPLPAAAWMGLSMLGGLGVVNKWRNRFASNR